MALSLHLRAATSSWRKRAKYVLDNVRASYGNTAGLASRASSFAEDSGLELTLANFLDYYHLDPQAIYKFSSFSRICARADSSKDFSEPLEEILTKAFGRLAVIDSRRWIRFLLELLPCLDNVDFTALGEVEQRMLQMFYVTVWGKEPDSPTGQRYIHHRERRSKVLLFVREFKSDRITGSAAAYTFLRTANYVKHEGGRPINITWKLDRPIPAKFMKKTKDQL